MNEFMTELFPWLLIIASLTVFAIVNAKEKSDSEKKPHKFIKGLCVMLSTTAFLYIVLKWDLWICIGCGILLGVGGFHFGSHSSSSKND